MKHKYAFWFALPLCMGLACTPAPQEKVEEDLIGYTNPMIGTDFTEIPIRELRYRLVWCN